MGTVFAKFTFRGGTLGARRRAAIVNFANTVPILFCLGCSTNSPTYVQVAPVEVDGMATRASTFVDLQFRAPMTEERQQLAQTSQQRGFEAPYVSREDVAVEVLYTITNLANATGTARIDVSGGSEFVTYDPDAFADAQVASGIDEDEVIVLPLVQGTPITVGAGQTVQGRVREDDLAEAALDLDAIGRWMATPAAVLLNRSEANRAGLEQVPANVIIPGFVRLQISLDANRHMRATFSVRVRDAHERLSTTPPLFAPMPMAVMPAGMAP